MESRHLSLQTERLPLRTGKSACGVLICEIRAIALKTLGSTITSLIILEEMERKIHRPRQPDPEQVSSLVPSNRAYFSLGLRLLTRSQKDWELTAGWTSPSAQIREARCATRRVLSASLAIVHPTEPCPWSMSCPSATLWTQPVCLRATLTSGGPSATRGTATSTTTLSIPRSSCIRQTTSPLPHQAAPRVK